MEQQLSFAYNDGGRAESGFRGDVGDCVVRAIAIATGLPYIKVYQDLKQRNKEYAETRRTRRAKTLLRKGSSPRDGNFREIYEEYLKDLGWTFTPTMGFGTGCTVHLRKDELPSGILICRVSRHLVTVIEGEINDTYNPSRGGTRCVYGYYRKEAQSELTE